jgi:hypothetical protein
MVQAGQIGFVSNGQIQVNGNHFDYDDRWKTELCDTEGDWWGHPQGARKLKWSDITEGEELVCGQVKVGEYEKIIGANNYAVTCFYYKKQVTCLSSREAREFILSKFYEFFEMI